MKRIATFSLTLILLTLFAASAFAQPSNKAAVVNPTANHVVISQTRTSPLAGVSFVELYNPTSSAVDISGWDLMLSDNLGTTSLVVTINPSVSIQPFSFYLIGSAAIHGGATSDTTVAFSISYTGGVAILDAGDVVVDAVGFSGAP